MADKKKGQSIFSLFGFLGVLLLVAGISIVLGSRNNLVGIGIGIVPVMLGGLIVIKIIRIGNINRVIYDRNSIFETLADITKPIN